MNNTDIIKLVPEQVAKDELKKIVTYAYTALGQKPADQTIEMSADFIYDKLSKDATLQQVKDLVRQALDTTENRQLNPKWFADVIKSAKSGINRPQDWEDANAPQSTGDDVLDTKINFMTMWALHKLGHTHYGCNWRVQYAFLINNGIIDEPDGWLKEWLKRAKSHIIAKSDEQGGTLRQILSGRSQSREAAQDDRLLQETVYELRVREVIEKTAEALSVDDFCIRFNKATPNTAPVGIILDDKIACGFYVQYTINGTTKQIR